MSVSVNESRGVVYVLVGILTGIVAVGGEAFAGGFLELELLAIGVGDWLGQYMSHIDWGRENITGVSKRVEVQRSGNGHCDDEIGRGDERVGGGVGVVATSEVTVVGRDDGVGSALLDIAAIPISRH